MMSVIHLLWIVPASGAVGYFICAILSVGKTRGREDRYDRRENTGRNS